MQSILFNPLLLAIFRDWNAFTFSLLATVIILLGSTFNSIELIASGFILQAIFVFVVIYKFIQLYLNHDASEILAVIKEVFSDSKKGRK